jgi:hypothetical protein
MTDDETPPSDDAIQCAREMLASHGAPAISDDEERHRVTMALARQIDRGGGDRGASIRLGPDEEIRWHPSPSGPGEVGRRFEALEARVRALEVLELERAGVLRRRRS